MAPIPAVAAALVIAGVVSGEAQPKVQRSRLAQPERPNVKLYIAEMFESLLNIYQEQLAFTTAMRESLERGLEADRKKLAKNRALDEEIGLSARRTRELEASLGWQRDHIRKFRELEDKLREVVAELETDLEASRKRLKVNREK